MPCMDKELLRAKYGKTTARFAEIVMKLQRQTKCYRRPEYDLRLQLAQDARTKSEEARIVLSAMLASITVDG
jgi:tRNA A-37 threonylcarbamoyl transferase component Bud32